MNINEFIQKSGKINELNILRSHRNNYSIEIGGSKAVAKHLQNIIENIDIDNYEIIIHEDEIMLINKEEINIIIDVIKKAESYEEIVDKITKLDIVNSNCTWFMTNKIKIELNYKPETKVFKREFGVLYELTDIEVIDETSYSIMFSSDKLTRFQECRQYCKDKYKIEKINEIFDL